MFCLILNAMLQRDKDYLIVQSAAKVLLPNVLLLELYFLELLLNQVLCNTGKLFFTVAKMYCTYNKTILSTCVIDKSIIFRYIYCTKQMQFFFCGIYSRYEQYLITYIECICKIFLSVLTL